MTDDGVDPAGRYLARSDLEINEVADGLIVYDSVSSQVHHLNLSAGTVFALCDGTRDAVAIAAEIADLLSVDHNPLDEVVSCLADLIGLRLIAEPRA